MPRRSHRTRWLFGGALVCLGLLAWRLRGRPRSDLAALAAAEAVESPAEPQPEPVEMQRIEQPIAPESAPEDRDCLDLEADGRSQVECLLASADRAERLAPEAVAQVLCDRGAPPRRVQALARAMFEHVLAEGGSALAAMRTVYARCRGFRLDDLFAAVAKAMSTESPRAYRRWVAELTPEALFDPASDLTVIRLAGKVAAWERDEALASVLEAGALGELGGSSLQIDAALSASFELQPSAEEAEELLRAMLSHSAMPEDAATSVLGATMCLLTTSTRLESVLDDERRERLFLDVLADRRFALGAATQLVRYLEPDSPPPCRMSASTWEHIRGASRELIELYGVRFE